MAESRSTYRYAALLLVGSVLAVAALVVSGIENADAPAAEASTVATATRTEDADFRKWADDGDVEEGKGRLIGEIEHNGQMVELRELPPGADPNGQKPDGDEPPADPNPDPGPGDPAMTGAEP